MIIPLESLDPATLQAIIETFVTREGTDYGEHELSLEQKSSELHQQLKVGDLVIVFDQATESVNIMSQQDYREGFTSLDGQD